MNSTRQQPSEQSGILRQIFGVFTHGQLFKSLLYLLLAFPLGVFVYTVVFGVGFTLSLATSVVGIGIVFLLLLMLLVRVAVSFERWLAQLLLNVSLGPSPAIIPEGSPGEKLRFVMDDALTWRGLGFLLLKSWVGIVGLLLAVAFGRALLLMVSLVDRPMTHQFGEVNGQPVTWTVETVPEGALAAGIGFVAVVIVAHLTNGAGYVAGRIAEALLTGK